MSKHTKAEEKLKVSRQVRPKTNPMVSRNVPDSSAPQVPDKGTNANNQYR